MELFTQAITNMASLQIETEEKVAVDSNWKSSKRISISAIKSRDKLQERIEDLQNDRLDLQKIMANQIITVLQIHGRTPEEAHSEATSCVFFRIGDDTLALYADLHRFLGVQYAEHGWDETRFLLQHYSSKLTSFRGRYNSRVQCLARTYCFLRDMGAQGWISNKLNSKRIARMMRASQPKHDVNKYQGDKLDNGPGVCGHCGTRIHYGGGKKCPWKDLTKDEAKKAAMEKIKNMKI